MNRANVGIADVVRAQEALKPRGRAVEVLVEICGLALTPPLTALHPAPDAADLDDQEHEIKEGGPGSSRDLDLRRLDALPPDVHRLQPVRQGQTPTTTPDDPLKGIAVGQDGRRPRFRGLLAQRDAADLACSAVSLPVATNAIHVERATEDLARAKPLLSLPRVHVPSLVLGTHILVDVGESMQPFREDQEELLHRFRSNLREHLHVRYFVDDPARGVGKQLRRVGWSRWTPPNTGTPVVVLSDLGCGFPLRSRATQAWLVLAERLRQRRCRLVVFAPVRLGRLPRGLKQAGEVLVWDRPSGRRDAARLRRALNA